MGRKSRAKAAHRVAQARAAKSALAPTAPVTPPRSDEPPSTPTQALWPSAGPPMAAPTSAPLRGGEPLTRSTREGPPAGSCDRLHLSAEQQLASQQAVEDEIRALLAGGRSWTDIGHALGLSRQGARQRYRRLGGDADRP